LWGKASDSDVHRLSSDERLPTVHELRKVRTRSERFFLNTKIAVKTALVHPGGLAGGGDRSERHKQYKN
jgi:hypothetical protein